MKSVAIHDGECNKRPRVAVDMSVPSPKTDRQYLQKTVLMAYQKIAAGAGNLTDEQVIAEFDRKYRPFVYRKMLDSKGLFKFRPVLSEIGGVSVLTPMRGNISGADIWTNVCTKLFRIGLPRFDFNGDKIGQGAFRSFMTTMAYHEYLDIVRHENAKGNMVPARDCRGNIIYTVNRKGDRVPIMMPRETNDVDETVIAVAERNNSMADKADIDLKAAIELRLDQFYLAYLIVRSRMNEDGWGILAMEEFFEKGIKRDVIIDRLLRDGAIKNRDAYDVCYHRFLMAIRKEQKSLDKLCRGSYDPKDDLEKEWSKMSVKVGIRRVRDIRGRIVDAMLEKMQERGRK